MENMEQLGISGAAGVHPQNLRAGALTVRASASYSSPVCLDKPALADILGVKSGTTIYVSDPRAARFLESLDGNDDGWRAAMCDEKTDPTALAEFLWRPPPSPTA